MDECELKTMKGNGKELFAKIKETIKDETTGLSLPTLTPVKKYPIQTSIFIVNGSININGIDTKILIKLNKQGYWISIGGLIKMVKTVEQLNEIIDINAQIQSTNDERTSFIEKLRKSGLEEIEPPPLSIFSSYSSYSPSHVTGFKIDDKKSIWIIDWLKTSSPLCNKIVGFGIHYGTKNFYSYHYFKPKSFEKELEVLKRLNVG